MHIRLYIITHSYALNTYITFINMQGKNVSLDIT